MKILKSALSLLIALSLFEALFIPLFVQADYSVVSIIPPTFTFQNNLQFKDNSVDVFFLQIVLNSDPGTSISTAGLGSPGQETTYFGGYTKLAVIRFQNKYASEILTPLGLSQGTGYVGPTTRTKLNEILNNLREAASSSSSSAVTASSSTASSSSSVSQGGSNASSGSISNGSGSSVSGIGGAAVGIGAGASAGGSAASSNLLKPFGGQVDYVDYYSCSCSGGILVWVQDKVPPNLIKRLVYQAGVSRLNSNYNLFIPGVETVGSYIPIPTICLAYTGTSCTQQYNDGLITPTPLPGVGTTLSPVAS